VPVQTLDRNFRRVPQDTPLFPAGLTFSAGVSDFAHLAELSPNWRGEFVPLGAGAFSGRMAVAHSGNVQLARIDYSGGFSFLGNVPKHAYTFLMPLAGERGGVFRSTEMSELDIAVVRFGEDAAYHTTGPTRHLVISISETLLEERLDTLRPDENEPDGRIFQFAGAERRAAFLRDAQRSLAMAQEYPELLTRPDRAELFERRLVQRLLHAMRPDPRIARSAERHRLARLAHRYLLERVRENVSLLELCEALRANQRTLLLGFAETYGTAPMAYLRGVRLGRAMRELRRGGRGMTVTKVASNWGFLHFGRFSEKYRTTFGETPRETLLGARERPLIEWSA
jgi:AraC family ethanolamine operon transcriptional activator